MISYIQVEDLFYGDSGTTLNSTKLWEAFQPKSGETLDWVQNGDDLAGLGLFGTWDIIEINWGLF